jgi:mono/diheme cytochrome c family protein
MPMWLRRLMSVLAVAIVVGIAGVIAYGWDRTIEPLASSPQSTFDKSLIAKGAELAAIGNCAVCHTAPGGDSFAGGLPIPTPFGTIYSTNITPDPQTGIGRWPEAAFARAMRRGVDREGRHLYPAFPYDHFTRITDEDNRALYAFLMTRKPVAAAAQPNDLAFPFNWRPILAGWKLLFLREGPQQPDLARSGEWNRGAYLVEGLGHCGACHTPRNRFGAERADAHFGGGEAEGWFAYAINERSPAPVPWSVDSLHFYLRHGWHPEHGVSRGPMAAVTANLAALPDADIRAIAVYVGSIIGKPDADRQARASDALTRATKLGVPPPTSESQTTGSARGDDPGAAIYAAACASCHESGRQPPYGGLNFHLSSAVNGPNPDNIINVVLYGLAPAEGQRSAIMPGFAGVMSDQQLAELLRYLRSAFSGHEPWTDLAATIAKQRRERDVALYPTDGEQAAPADPGRRVTSW